jgi:hypothetical protein
MILDLLGMTWKPEGRTLWDNLAVLGNKSDLAICSAVQFAVKVFLNSAVGLIGKVTAVLWVVSLL